MDLFNETIIKRKMKGLDYLIIVGVILAATVLTFVALLFYAYLAQFFFLLVAALYYGAYFLITSRKIEYEYILTNSELDIDKIINMKRRKRMLNVDCKLFSEFVQITGDIPSSQGEKLLDFSSGNQIADRYMAVFSKDGQRFRLIFEPTQAALDIIKRYVKLYKN